MYGCLVLVRLSSPEMNMLRSDPLSADEDGTSLRLQLRHVLLSELEAQALVIWDRDNDVVRKGPDFDENAARRAQ